jgi:outer membrane protein assembly factor BamD
MFRRVMIAVLLALVMISAVACTNKKVKNPLAQVDSKQPDKVLFDRAMEAMKKNRYDVARLSLQTLINTYPDSEYIARAKLGIADSWYAEGGSAALAQAENEYKDFITFFPNMPEAAEAQVKVAGIHYRQMEKADRDYTHAKRAEDEYRQLLLQFPDSKLADEARVKLLEVQEVLAEREFRIGHFYYMRQSYAAASARLKSLADTYPLYSNADEVLFELGDMWETQLKFMREAKGLTDANRQKVIRDYTDRAAAAYSKIITRYPVMPRAGEAKARLAALDRPVPTPTADAIAQNKAEQDSRESLGKMGKLMLNMKKRPDVKLATKVGQPTLTDPQPTSAPALIRDATTLAAGTGAATGKVSAETMKDVNGVPANQPVPRSDSQTPPAPEGVGELKPNTDASSTSSTTTATPPAPEGVGELKPNTEASSTPSTTTATPPAPEGVGEIKPAADANSSSSTPTSSSTTSTDPTTGNPAPAPAPPQVNEAAGSTATPAADSGTSTTPPDPKKTSSSKKKEKKGLRKVIPF